jgi:hypothetical protein
MDADQDRLFGLLLGEVIPPVSRLELDRRCFATDVLIDQVAGDQIIVRKASRITKRQR